jgi:hypothetical protein
MKCINKNGLKSSNSLMVVWCVEIALISFVGNIYNAQKDECKCWFSQSRKLKNFV